MHILAIDQGTTGTTAVLYDRQARPAARAYRELPQIYPRPGWVEHDPLEIWRTVAECVEEVCAGGRNDIAAVGITNQRETTLVWDARSGEPVHNAIVWQCRRTAEACERLRAWNAEIRRRTGLPVDAYFSATKIRWILDHVPERRVEDLLFGTVDSWLIWKLTDGAAHVTDHTNASRTLLFDIAARRWDEGLCALIGVPPHVLPEVRPSVAEFGTVRGIPALEGVPILGVAGDQQAALFGQTCFERGEMKNTYGTGAFVVMNTGPEPVVSSPGLVTTLAVDGTGGSCYALEGSIFVAGAAVQWLRDELGLIDAAADSEAAARRVDDNGGVYLVPAFVGLGAPHWDMRARGALVGLTRGARRDHVIRAALESMAYQTADVLEVMEGESGAPAAALAVDGGACANDFLMQFQADIIDRPVVRPRNIETTSLGAAYLAGLHAGLWPGAETLRGMKRVDREFGPAMDAPRRTELLDGWRRAVRQARAQ